MPEKILSPALQLRSLPFRLWGLAACHSLDIEDGVLRVHGGLVLSGLTDQTLLIGEGDEGGSSKATLLVGDYFTR